MRLLEEHRRSTAQSRGQRGQSPPIEATLALMDSIRESLQSVVHTILGEVLQETFVIGPGVSGQVTFSNFQTRVA